MARLVKKLLLTKDSYAIVVNKDRKNAIVGNFIDSNNFKLSKALYQQK
jgi:hypothetical protein